MEIKLKSYFIEVPDDKLNLFSSTKNKLDKNDLYNKIITDIQTIDRVDQKKLKSIKNDEKKNFRKENKLIGTLYYGKYGMEQSRIYNIENEEKEEITEKEVMEYFLKNSVTKMKYVSYKEKDVNNIFGKLLDEKEKKKFLILILDIKFLMTNYFIKS